MVINVPRLHRLNLRANAVCTVWIINLLLQCSKNSLDPILVSISKSSFNKTVCKKNKRKCLRLTLSFFMLRSAMLSFVDMGLMPTEPFCMSFFNRPTPLRCNHCLAENESARMQILATSFTKNSQTCFTKSVSLNPPVNANSSASQDESAMLFWVLG